MCVCQISSRGRIKKGKTQHAVKSHLFFVLLNIRLNEIQLMFLPSPPQEQYEFCYKVVQEYIDAFSDYANFK